MKNLQCLAKIYREMVLSLSPRGLLRLDLFHLHVPCKLTRTSVLDHNGSQARPGRSRPSHASMDLSLPQIWHYGGHELGHGAQALGAVGLEKAVVDQHYKAKAPGGQPNFQPAVAWSSLHPRVPVVYHTYAVPQFCTILRKAAAVAISTSPSPRVSNCPGASTTTTSPSRVCFGYAFRHRLRFTRKANWQARLDSYKGCHTHTHTEKEVVQGTYAQVTFEIPFDGQS